MGYPGVELSWKPGRDYQWLSYYEVLRDGTVLGKAAKGTYYYDHSAGADMAANYEVRAFDGAGLRSTTIEVLGPGNRRAVILDDATQGQGLT